MKGYGKLLNALKPDKLTPKHMVQLRKQKMTAASSQQCKTKLLLMKMNVTHFYCHAKVHDSAKRVLQRGVDHYGVDRIKVLGLDLYAGCFDERRMRGGTH